MINTIKLFEVKSWLDEVDFQNKVPLNKFRGLFKSNYHKLINCNFDESLKCKDLFRILSNKESRLIDFDSLSIYVIDQVCSKKEKVKNDVN